MAAVGEKQMAVDKKEAARTSRFPGTPCLKPTRGLEPRTPSLRVSRRGSGCLRMFGFLPANGQFLPTPPVLHSEPFLGVGLPRSCPGLGSTSSSGMTFSSSSRNVLSSSAGPIGSVDTRSENPGIPQRTAWSGDTPLLRLDEEGKLRTGRGKPPTLPVRAGGAGARPTPRFDRACPTGRGSRFCCGPLSPSGVRIPRPRHITWDLCPEPRHATQTPPLRCTRRFLRSAGKTGRFRGERRGSHVGQLGPT